MATVRRLYIVDDDGDELWLIDQTDPDSTAGDFGEVGSFPSSLTSPRAIAAIGSDLYVADLNGAQLWKINPSDPDSETGGYGLVGTFPSTLTNPRGMASDGTDLYVADLSGAELWKIDPSDPDRTTGGYGLVGTFPSGLSQAAGATFHNGDLYIIDDASDRVWLIDHTDPDRETGGYGNLGSVASTSLVSAGIASDQTNLYLVDNINDQLWLINPADPDDETGSYGTIGDFPTNLEGPHGAAFLTIPNTAPIAAIQTTPMTVDGGDTVTLAGTVTDADTGDTLTQLWTETGGTLANETTLTPTWTAPAGGTTDQTYTISLVGNDGEDDSNTATVIMTVRAAVTNVTLSANAGNPTAAADLTAVPAITLNAIPPHTGEIVRSVIAVASLTNWLRPDLNQGSFTGDMEVEPGLSIGYARVTRNANGDFLTLRRPVGATTGNMGSAFGPGGTFENLLLHLERNIKPGETEGDQRTSFVISDEHLTSGVNWAAFGPFPSTSDYTQFIEEVEPGDRINFVIAGAAQSITVEASAGAPTAAFGLTAIALLIDQVAVSAQAGAPTAAFNLVRTNPVALSASAGNPTAQANLTPTSPVAFEASAGNPTAAADALVKAPISIDTIPPHDGEVVRALLTSSGGTEPTNLLGSSSSDSDLAILDNLVINQIRWWTSDNRMFFNRPSGAGFNTYFGSGNPGANNHIYLAVLHNGSVHIVDIDVADNIANKGGQAAVGALRIRMIPASPDAAALDSIVNGSLINLVIANEEILISATAVAGNPTAEFNLVTNEPVAVDASAGQPTATFGLTARAAPTATAISFTASAGQPTTTLALTAQAAPDTTQVAVSVDAGSPTATFSVTPRAPPTATSVSVSASSGSPTASLALSAIAASAPIAISVSASAGSPIATLALTARAAPPTTAISFSANAGAPTVALALTAQAPPATTQIAVSALAGEPVVVLALSALTPAGVVASSNITRRYTIGGTGDVRRDVMGGVQMSHGHDLGSPLSPPIVSKCSFGLWNMQGVYAVGETGEITTGAEIDVVATHDTIEHELWVGSVFNVKRVTPGSSRQLAIECLGPMHALVRETLSTALYENVRTDECLQVILDALGITGYTLARGDTILRYWWLNNENCFTAVRELVASEGQGAKFFARPDGSIEFQNRNFRTTSQRAINTQQAFIDGSDPSQDGIIYLQPLNYDTPQTYIVNECFMDVVTRSAKAEAEVWKYADNLTIGAGQSITLTAVFNDPVKDVVAPTSAEGDFTRVSGGADPAITLDRTSGQRLTLTIAATSAVIISGLRLRAAPVSVDSSLQAQSNVDTSAAIAAYEKRSLTISGRREIDPNTATDICNAIVLGHQTGLPTFYVRVTNSTPESAEAQLGLRISDRVSILKEDDLRVSTNAFIEQIIHRVQGQGAVHETIFGCTGAPTFTDDTLILGSATRGILGTNTLGA